MKSINKCQFIGNLGKDPEVRYTQSGVAVATVSIACTEKWKENEHTEWVRLTFWDKLAEIAQKYLFKGDPIYVEGQMRTRKYQASDGSDRYATEIRVQDLVMLGGKRDDNRQPRQPAQKPAQQSAPADDGFAFDDIPF